MNVLDSLSVFGRIYSYLDSSGPGEDFRPVFEAYEEFYKEANTSKGRFGTTTDAAQEFMGAVGDYYDAGEDEFDAAIGFGLLVNSDDLNLLDQKLSEEELYRYLEGEL